MTPDSPQILEHYREIVAVTTAMLNAARTGDWNSVLRFGHAYCDAVERLRALGGPAVMDDHERQQKYDMLVQILENDAHTRDLAMPELARMSELLGNMKRQQGMVSAYGSEAGSA